VYAQPYQYELFILDFGLETKIGGVNDSGTVAGWVRIASNDIRGLIWTENGGPSYVSSPETPALPVQFNDISNDGIAAGNAGRTVGANEYFRVHTYDTNTATWTQIHPWAGCTSFIRVISETGFFAGEVQHLNNGNCGAQFVTDEAFVGIGSGAVTVGRLSSDPSHGWAVNNNGDLLADFTGDGELNFFDVSAFLVAFNAGCP
jgi:hypothetical protein